MKTRENLVNLGVTEIKAEEIMLLESKMMEQAVKFQFVKKDGSIRNAVGTLKRDLMKLADGTLWEPKGESKPENPAIVKFFDVEAQGWRCFSCISFIGMEG